MVKKQDKRKRILNSLVAIVILAILLIIPFTRIALIEIGKLIGGLILWILLLFLAIILIKWVVVRKK